MFESNRFFKDNREPIRGFVSQILIICIPS
nr:MAG TPA: hypothetical protein [Caudoviricetes sp.]